ncbi:MAG: cyclic nucleotide-binding domain-containing protein [Rhizobiales bacterium]|nr:cyclic nucleotide-binding domain-containing protein [Hyphomicrobiales bacterium]
MSIDNIIMPMLSVPFFEGLAISQLKSLAVGAERLVFNDGQVLIREGASGNAAYLVVDGKVLAYHGAAPGPDAKVHGVGTMLAEIAMVTETNHVVTVRALGKVRVLGFSRHMMHAYFAEDPGLAQHFLEVLTHRLKEISDVLRETDAMLGADAEPAAPTPNRRVA